MNPLISDLALYDIANTPGVAADLSHTNTTCSVKGYAGEEQLADALKGCDLVIIPAGVPRKPGMTRDDLFNTNAGIVKTLVEGVGKYCPNAVLGIILTVSERAILRRAIRRGAQFPAQFG